MTTKAAPEFWKSSGFHLLNRNADGWLTVTPDFLRAYLTRPEVHPIDTSCDNEITLFESLMENPARAVGEDQLSALADPDAADNYRVVLAFRDLLRNAETLEAAYLKLMTDAKISIPPVFIDQLVHAILRNVLQKCEDPIRLRAAELFFREQTVSTDDGRIMLADQEIVDMHSKTGGVGVIGQLLNDTGTPMKQVEMDVLDEDNAKIYWDRSDRFDTVIDLRFTQPANHALARVIEAWIAHFMKLAVTIKPMQTITDEAWRWHIGLDREATELLNTLYEGLAISLEDQNRLLALYQMDIREQDRVLSDVRGRPVYLALGMSPEGRTRLKPQNLLTNLPLSQGS